MAEDEKDRNKGRKGRRKTAAQTVFFIKTLMQSIEPDGSFGVPVYSFVSDTSDITVVPAKAED